MMSMLLPDLGCFGAIPIIGTVFKVESRQLVLPWIHKLAPTALIPFLLDPTAVGFVLLLSLSTVWFLLDHTIIWCRTRYLDLMTV